MSLVIATPQILATAAADLADIGATVSDANAATAAVTTGLVPAAQDEVSEGIAALFGGYAKEYHSLSAQAAEFHERLVQALSTSAGSYAAAESANAAALLQTARQDLLQAVNAPVQAILGHPLTGDGGLLSGQRGTGGTNGVAISTAASSVTGDVALIMSGTGLKGGTLRSGLPTQQFFNGVISRYIDPTQPLFTGQNVFPGYDKIPLATPEQDRPFTGLHDLTLEQSMAQGLANLNTAITQTYAGQNIVVLGYSQSATIATLEMNALQAAGTIDPASLHFVLLGDPNNPNGGIFVRQSALPNSPSYYTPTPSNTPYATDIYTIQYDGFADFPRYPINLLADVNAGMGMVYAHLDYSTITPAQLATAVQLSTSPGYYADGGVTNYYMIPSQQLPLLEPLYHAEQTIPVLKPAIQPFIDLVQPDLKYLVDLGYDDPFASTTYANVPTTTALFPNVGPLTILVNLNQNTAAGVNAALADFGLPQIAHAQLSQLVSQLPPVVSELPNFSDLTGGLGAEVFGSAGSTLQTQLQGFLLDGVTDLGVNLAVDTALIADPSWILNLLG